MLLPEDAAREAGIRRVSPVRHVLTIFGDYWWRVDEPLPTGALVAALADLGLQEAAARATLRRMTTAGLLDAQRDGRRTSHRLTPRAGAVIDEQAAWLDAFGVAEPTWDGLWSVLAFSIPESQRSLRHQARSRLKWLGFAPRYDGVWISPHDRAEDAMAQLRELGVFDVTAMRASLLGSAPGGPQQAWDLAAVAARYRAFADEIAATDPAAEPVAAFVARTRHMLTWQEFRLLDTGIPVELVPDDWPRAATRRAWVACHNTLGAAAEQRVRDLVADVAPDLASLVTRRRLPG